MIWFDPLAALDLLARPLRLPAVGEPQNPSVLYAVKTLAYPLESLSL